MPVVAAAAVALTVLSDTANVCFTHRPRAGGHSRTDRATQGKGKRESRVNSAPRTAGPGDSSPGSTCLLLSPRDESLIAGKSRCWVGALVPNVTVIEMFSQAPFWCLIFPVFKGFSSVRRFSVLGDHQPQYYSGAARN